MKQPETLTEVIDVGTAEQRANSACNDLLCCIHGVRWMRPFTEDLTRWSEHKPSVAGMYLWADPTGKRTCLFAVADRGDGRLAVEGNILPTDEYRGFWIGPIESNCELVTEQTPRHLLHD